METRPTKIVPMHGPGGVPLALRTRPPATITPGKILRRERLLRTLRDRLDRNIVLVQAPAGYGKSYLLADAFAHLKGAGLGSAWLTIAAPYPAEDMFLAELSEACGLAGRTGAGTAESRLADELGSRQAKTVLFLDACDAGFDGIVAPVLDRLVGRLPDKLSIVLASRRRLAHSAFSRLLLDGAVARIGCKELAFSESDAVDILPEGTTANDIARAASFAQGWPAILRLASLVLETGGQLDELLEGSFPPMRHYLEEQVFPDFGPHFQEAFQLSGFVDAVSPDLLLSLKPQIMPPQDARDILEEAEPLVSRVNDRPGWYRVHPAIAAIHKHAFAALPRSERTRRHAQVARWFAANDYLEEAVNHAAETGDFVLAESAIREAGGVRIFLRSGFSTLRRLLSHLPTHVILSSSGLQLCQAVVLGKQGQLEQARGLVDEVMRAVRSGEAQVDVLPEDVSHIDSLINCYEDVIGHPRVVARLEREARSLTPRAHWRIAWLANHLCLSHTILGNFDRAESEGLKALTCYRQENVRYAQVFMLIHLALLAITRGKPLSAFDFTDEAETLCETSQRGDQYLKAILSVPMAEANYARGEIDRACMLLDAAIPCLEAGEAWVDIYARAYQTRVAIAIIRNETRHALRIIDMAEQVAQQRRLPRLKLFTTLLRLEVMSRVGLTEAAEHLAPSVRWLAETEEMQGLDEAGERPLFTWREKHMALRLMARLHWSRREPEKALAFLARLEESARETGAGLDQATALALKFCYLWHMKRPDEAREKFQLAVALATPQRIVRIFADESYMMAVAIRGILRHFGASAFSHATIEFTNTILVTHIGQESAGDPARGGRLEILLTDHEREILEHLARGLSNKEIALLIGRKEATVKYHLRRIYTKLGVRSRGLAVVMARKASLVI